MFINNKQIKYYVITVIYMAVFGATFAIGISNNPNFNIYDFCMSFASELLGIAFAVIIVDSYIKMKTERNKEKNQMNIGENVPDIIQSGFETFGGGSGAVKNVSVLRDTKTGIQYLFVVCEDGSGLTPLLDKDGKPVTENRAE